MRYESVLEVAGAPAEVLETFANLPMVASFLPGASVGPANPDGTHPGSLVVSFGPKKIAFKGKVENRVDRETLSGVVSGTASADVRGARMAVTMRYRLAPGTERPGGTRVALESDAELTGMLAEFAQTGGVVLANAVLAKFADRLSAHFEARAAAAGVAAPLSMRSAAQPPAMPATAPAPSTLSATWVAGAVLRSLAASFARAVARRWRALVGTRN